LISSLPGVIEKNFHRVTNSQFLKPFSIYKVQSYFGDDYYNCYYLRCDAMFGVGILEKCILSFFEVKGKENRLFRNVGVFTCTPTWLSSHRTRKQPVN